MVRKDEEMSVPLGARTVVLMMVEDELSVLR